MSRHRSVHYLIVFAKVGLAGLLLWWLVNSAVKNESFDELKNKDKDWGLLALATLCCLASVTITILRWMMLVRALGIPFPLKDAFRLGFQSYALNFVSLGSVGGDLFKAIFIAREQHSRRAEAVATVIVDRLVGLYALFLVSSGAIVFAWFQGAAWVQVPQLKTIITMTHVCTIVGGVACVLLAMPNFTRGKIKAAAEKLPFGSHVVLKLLEAVHLYRSQRTVMLITVFISLFVHLLLSLSVWLISKGLLENSLTLEENLLAAPLASLVGAIPIFPLGLGAFEGALDFLYVKISAGAIKQGQGLIVALGFRVVTMIVAIPGVYYNIVGRRAVAEVMHEVEEVEELESESELSEENQPAMENN